MGITNVHINKDYEEFQLTSVALQNVCIFCLFYFGDIKVQTKFWTGDQGEDRCPFKERKDSLNLGRGKFLFAGWS